MPGNTTTTQPDLVDVRGPRFAAWVTTAALVLVLIASAVNPLVAAVILALGPRSNGVLLEELSS